MSKTVDLVNMWQLIWKPVIRKYRVLPIAIWNRFVEHGEIASLRAKIGLSAPDILDAIEEYEEQE